MKLLISFKEIKKPLVLALPALNSRKTSLPWAFRTRSKLTVHIRGGPRTSFPPETGLLHPQMLLKIPAAGMTAAAAGGKLLTHFPLPTCSMPSCVNATLLKGRKVKPSDAPHTAWLSIKKKKKCIDGRKGVNGTNSVNAYFPLANTEKFSLRSHEFYNMMLFHGNQKKGENTLESS